MKRFAFFVVVLFSISMLCSCSGGISRDEADELARDMILMLQEDDIAGAVELMHPSTNTTESYLDAHIAALETDSGIDFSEVTDIELRTNFSSSLYSSDVGGSRYEINYKLTQDDKTFNCAVEIVKIDDVMGVSTIFIKAE